MCIRDSGLHSALQNGLAVPHALLADGSADAGNAGLKQRFGTICGGIQHSGSFVCRQVDDVQRFIGGNAAFAAGDGAEQVVQLHQFFRDQAAADGVVRHSVPVSYTHLPQRIPVTLCLKSCLCLRNIHLFLVFKYTLRQVNDIGKRNPKRKTQPGSRRFGHYTEQ